MAYAGQDFFLGNLDGLGVAFLPQTRQFRLGHGDELGDERRGALDVHVLVADAGGDAAVKAFPRYCCVCGLVDLFRRGRRRRRRRTGSGAARRAPPVVPRLFKVGRNNRSLRRDKIRRRGPIDCRLC